GNVRGIVVILLNGGCSYRAKEVVRVGVGSCGRDFLRREGQSFSEYALSFQGETPIKHRVARLLNDSLKTCTRQLKRKLEFPRHPPSQVSMQVPCKGHARCAVAGREGRLKLGYRLPAVEQREVLGFFGIVELHRLPAAVRIEAL